MKQPHEQQSRGEDWPGGSVKMAVPCQMVRDRFPDIDEEIFQYVEGKSSPFHKKTHMNLLEAMWKS
ncbi:hypothetical protein E2C01_080267 [Portunus trituberculatus]|uniref:Uncharacterized protein n=1 Tax=Portunus trituberculatus TaxID=210409 RepID=A0A5B7ITM5_PORTR|nr:hypothetical protein [Portunus trituberculatus]